MGAVLAIVLMLMPALSGAALPVAVTLRSVSIVATAPLIVLALGRGTSGTVTIVAVMTFFRAFVACLHGLRQTPHQTPGQTPCQTPHQTIKVMRIYAVLPLLQLCHAQIPTISPPRSLQCQPPFWRQPTQNGWPRGRGLGKLMALSTSTSDYNLLRSAIVVITLASSMGYGLISMAERAVLARIAPEQLRG